MTTMIVNRPAAAAIAALLAMTAATLPAAAQGPPQGALQPCGAALEMIAEFARVHDEVPVWRGLLDNRRMFILIVASKAGTWTALQIDNSDRACAIAFGTDAETIAASLPGESL